MSLLPSFRLERCALSSEVLQRAYQQALDLVIGGSDNNSSSTSTTLDTSSVVTGLRKYLKPQDQKTQLQLSLGELDALWASSSDAEKTQLDALMAAQSVLRDAATRYLNDLIALVPSAEGLREDHLEKKSMFRIWVYFQGGDCRPHYDPGIVTALFPGSSPGLSLNFTDVLKHTNGLGDYTESKNHETDEASESQHWHSVDDLLLSQQQQQQQQEEASVFNAAQSVLLMADTVTQVVTAGKIPHVLHRVVDHDGRATTYPRVNLIVELRPHKPGKWYQFVPSAVELQNMS